MAIYLGNGQVLSHWLTDDHLNSGTNGFVITTIDTLYKTFINASSLSRTFAGMSTLLSHLDDTVVSDEYFEFYVKSHRQADAEFEDINYTKVDEKIIELIEKIQELESGEINDINMQNEIQTSKRTVTRLMLKREDLIRTFKNEIEANFSQYLVTAHSPICSMKPQQNITKRTQSKDQAPIGRDTFFNHTPSCNAAAEEIESEQVTNTTIPKPPQSQ